MDINPNDFPVTILFSGNVYDIRGLHFFTVINKNRFNLIQSKLDENELDFICKKHGNDYYIRFDFLQFIYEVGAYHRWLNNYSNDITNPKVKNIFYQFLYFPDTANNNNYANINNYSDTYYRNILKDYILFNGKSEEFDNIGNSAYEYFLNLYDRNKLTIDQNRFLYFIFTFFEFDTLNNRYLFDSRVKGYEDHNKNIINININSEIILNKILAIYNNPNLVINLNFNNNFIYKKNTPKMFDTLEKYKIDNVNILFDISKKLIYNYTKPNYIPNNNKDFGPTITRIENTRYDGYPSYYNVSKKINGTIKKIKNNEFKFILTPLNEHETKKDTVNNINTAWLSGLITELREINSYGNLIDRINYALLKKIDSKNKLLKKLQKIKNDYNMYPNIILIFEKYLQESTYIKHINLYNDEYYAEYNKLLSGINLSYIEISNKKDKIITKVNGIKNKNIHFITYSSIINQWINKKDDLIFSLIEINPDKCFNLGLNMNLEECSLNIIEVIHEDNYGLNTKRFFENDNNFYIHHHFEFKNQFKPNPHIILSLLKKIKFKKISINIYNHSINIIENYASWAKKYKTNKRLLNQKNLKIYIEKALLYINLNISILNPEYIDILDFIKQIIIKNNEYNRNLPIFKNYMNDNDIKEKFIKILINKFSNGNNDSEYDYVGIYNMIGGSSGEQKNYSGDIIYTINKIYNRFKKLKNKTTRSHQYIEVLKKQKNNAEISILLNN